MTEEEVRKLFEKLYQAKDEEEVNKVAADYSEIFESSENWRPLGQNDSNYSIVKNQQSNPVAALIEKITNSIDAILTKRCEEDGIDPKSSDAPQTMDKAVQTFFPSSDNWDIAKNRRKQAEDIQIIADGKGPRKKGTNYDTSVIIYDNGEGQKPENFETTFLSLMQKNKNDVPFVQGKYNMGGAGALVFCGRKRYQLIASKRYSGGKLGFTLVREHEIQENEYVKETWFEYLLIDGKIPSFEIDELDVGLQNRFFKSGSIIKLYSYELPSGVSGFAQELNQSINEYLFSPALPMLTKDTPRRYPNNKVLVNDLFGLKRRLKQEETDYLEDNFSDEFEDEWFGKIQVSCFVFKNKIKDYDLKKTKEVIRDRYFKNGMSVIFSLNGQVHGHYTTEFITKSLKMNLLKNHLLIHVDCTKMNGKFLRELFMASRDRLKGGQETQYLRQFLAKNLGHSKGRLAEIEKRRKNAADVDTSTNTKDLLKDLTKNMPLDSEMMKLLHQTFNLDQKQEKKKEKKPPKREQEKKTEKPFNPQRFPSYFQVHQNGKNDKPVAKIPEGSQKYIKFDTDVENDYFSRLEEPGELELAVLNINSNNTQGGTAPGEPEEPNQYFNVHKQSPKDGEIKVGLQPKEDLAMDDEVEIEATLTAPGENFNERFWVKISEPEQPKEEKQEKEEAPDIGLPDLVWAKQERDESNNVVSWEEVQNATGEDMDYETVMAPQVEGDKLEKVFVNMESRVLMNHKSKNKHPNEQQIEVANRKYYTSVYFHTLFLYTITKNRRYKIYQEDGSHNEPQPVDLGSYLKDLFDHYYSDFLLNFQMEQLMEGLED